MRPKGRCTQGVRLIKMLRILEKEGRLTPVRYVKEFRLNYRTWVRDLRAMREALEPFNEHIWRHGYNARLVRNDSETRAHMKAKDIKHLPTLYQGQFSDLKIDTGTFRVWLNRCNNEVEYERLVEGKWVNCEVEED